MYIPKHFAQNDFQKVVDFVKKYNFGILSSINSDKDEIISSHLPFYLEVTANGSYRLLCHFAKENEHWRLLNSNSSVQIIFNGPHAYISPLYYINTTVPTWNYTTVHATGTAHIIEADLDRHSIMQKLVLFHEPTNQSWKTKDIDQIKFEKLMKRIVTVVIDDLDFKAKFKLNQNKLDEDIQSVISHLLSNGGSDSVCGLFMKDFYKF